MITNKIDKECYPDDTINQDSSKKTVLSMLIQLCIRYPSNIVIVASNTTRLNIINRFLKIL